MLTKKQEVDYGPGNKKEVWMVVPSKDALKEKYDRRNKWPRDEDFKAEPEPRPRGDFIADHRGERKHIKKFGILAPRGGARESPTDQQYKK